MFCLRRKGGLPQVVRAIRVTLPPSNFLEQLGRDLNFRPAGPVALLYPHDSSIPETDVQLVDAQFLPADPVEFATIAETERLHGLGSRHGVLLCPDFVGDLLGLKELFTL